MKKRVFIVHGWGGFPNEGWFPWLKKELIKKGFEVYILSMPDSEAPDINKWIKFLSNNVGKSDKNTYFVGHSIGCQTILRYLETLPDNIKTGKIIFVAGWFHLSPEDTQEEEDIAKPWLETKIDFSKVRKHADNFTAIFSDNDPFVPLSDSKIFKKELNAKIIVEHNKKHFSGSDNIKKVDIVLEELLKSDKPKDI